MIRRYSLLRLAALAVGLCLMLSAQPGLAFVIGDNGAEVTRLQNALYALGYTESAPDGWYGAETRRAAQRLTSYAASLGLDLKEEQLAEAFEDGRLAPAQVITKKGDASEAVLLLQRRLRVLGYLADKADGRFGDNTQRALLIFQWEKGLALTGECDADTRKTLFRLDAAEAKESVLAKGMQSDRVLRLQERMWLLGFFAGDLDGYCGEQTVVGVKALETYIRTSGKFDINEKLKNTKPNGVADPLLLSALYADFPQPPEMGEGDSGQEVYRLQRRLIALGYLTQPPDGGYGQNTSAAVAAFQKRAGLKASGKASQRTIDIMFSDEAAEALRPYKLVIDISDQALRVYQIEGGEYTRLRFAMACSTGPEVKEGVYRLMTRPAEKWLEIKNLGWVESCFLLETGLRIHSVPYDAREGAPNPQYLSALGTPSQAGGIMLSPQNARLIYEKCMARTEVEIVE